MPFCCVKNLFNIQNTFYQPVRTPHTFSFLRYHVYAGVLCGRVFESNVAAVETQTVILNCSDSVEEPIATAEWSEGGVAFATQDGVHTSDPKYDNFETVNSGMANGQFNLRITNVQYEDGGSYSCYVNGGDTYVVSLTVEGGCMYLCLHQLVCLNVDSAVIGRKLVDSLMPFRTLCKFVSCKIH